ncbi:MAG: hypothetical protein ACR2G2_00190 [Pseudonocardia sp.]
MEISGAVEVVVRSSVTAGRTWRQAVSHARPRSGPPRVRTRRPPWAGTADLFINISALRRRLLGHYQHESGIVAHL